eukprot:90438_1
MIDVTDHYSEHLRHRRAAHQHGQQNEHERQVPGQYPESPHSQWHVGVLATPDVHKHENQGVAREEELQAGEEIGQNPKCYHPDKYQKSKFCRAAITRKMTAFQHAAVPLQQKHHD